MDYKYIEQLLERYWQGETTLQEEMILKTFFSQPDIPENLRKYSALFAYEAEKSEGLGDDFDARMLEMTGEAPKAEVITLTSRLKPLFKAAAIVAIVLTLGNAAQAPWDRAWDDPKEVFAKYHQQEADTVNALGTIQAENVADSVKTTTPEEQPAYFE